MILYQRDKTSISVISADALMLRIIEKAVKLRKEMGYSQSDMAQKFGISQMAYSKIESGKTDIGFAKAFNFCEILGITLSELLGLEDVISTSAHQVIAEKDAEIIALKNQVNDEKFINKLLRDKLTQEGIKIN